MIEGKLALEVRDIDTRSEWHERFFMDIPVVEFEGELVWDCRPDIDGSR